MKMIALKEHPKIPAPTLEPRPLRRGKNSKGTLVLTTPYLDLSQV